MNQAFYYNLQHHFLRHGPDMVIHHPIFNLSISLGEVISALVLLITAYFIYRQVEEAKISSKFLEYQIRPKAYPLLITAKEMGENSDRMVFVVINPDNYKDLFYTCITIGGTIVADRWQSNPLHVYPGPMSYPDVFALNQFDTYKKIEMTAKIEYKIAPSNAPQQIFDDYQEEIWKFKLNKETSSWYWEGPNGIGPTGVVSIINHANKL